METWIVVVSIDEIWLKGLNRNQYLKLLKKNVQAKLKKLTETKLKIQWEGPKLIIEGNYNFSYDDLITISKVPGVSIVTKAVRVETTLEAAKNCIVQKNRAWLERGGSFCVRAKRSYKSYPITSPEIGRQLGAMLLTEFPKLTVRLNAPEKMFFVRVTATGIFVSLEEVKGVGGLPVGSSGRSLCMLSGGFDSPVASYMMSRRGLAQDFVFFYAYPLVGNEVKEKILDLAKILTQYQGNSRLYVVMFGDIQKEISKYCPLPYRTILFRKAMVECGNLLAKKLKAGALIVGDSLSQVSSQTLENISLIDTFSELPILRPLVGFNKIDIVNLSKTIGTHDVSCRPHDDACDLFSPKHPVIRAKTEIVRDFDQSTSLVKKYSEAVQAAEMIYC